MKSTATVIDRAVAMTNSVDKWYAIFIKVVKLGQLRLVIAGIVSETRGFRSNQRANYKIYVE